MMDKRVYLAAPFFSDEQMALVLRMEVELSEHFSSVFSPRRDGGVLAPDASYEDRKKIFDQNVHAIKNSDFIVAVIDDFDPGTVWEMGAGYALGKPMLSYSDVAGRGLNVMLAQSSGFANGIVELKAALDTIENFGVPNMPTWDGDIQ